MKKIVLTPNPYRDRNFKYVTLADKLLREAGLETRICLAFDVDRSFELPDNVVLTELNHELRDADLLVCFGGDGTILHASKAATKAGIPVLGVNIGTMGFMAELESSELKELRRLADDDFSVEPRMMLHVRAEHEGRVILEEDALNDAVITKGRGRPRGADVRAGRRCGYDVLQRRRPDRLHADPVPRPIPCRLAARWSSLLHRILCSRRSAPTICRHVPSLRLQAARSRCSLPAPAAKTPFFPWTAARLSA